jgi:hypothetical protein
VASVSDLSFPELLDAIRSVQSAYHKLIIIVAASRSGKTSLLGQTAQTLNMPLINLNLEMSRRLLGLTKRQRMLNAEEIARGLLDEHVHSGLCLDNTEMLFDSALGLNPVLFLQNASRNRLIVSSWNGAFQDGALTFGYVGHPDFFRERVTGFPVVSVFGNKLQLNLTL